MSGLALTIGFLAAPAMAGTYHATDSTTLRNAIADANADADASATITLDNDVTITGGNLPAPTKPITIDAGSHTITSAYANGSTVSGAVNLNGGGNFPAGASYIFNGIIQGNTAGTGANGNGDQGLFMNVGKTVEIDGTVTGGAGGGLGGNGGTGVGITGVSTVTNKGAVAGGSAVNGNGGIGVNASTGGTVVNLGTVMGGDGLAGGIGVNAISIPNKIVMNSGTITGGKGTTGAGGDGVRLIQGNGINNSGAVTGGDGVTGGSGVNITGINALNPTFTNSGTIKGGNGSGGTGGNGVIVHASVGTMTNTGTITGGAGAAAIMNTGLVGATNAPVSLVNSGTIAAGAGFDTAILMQVPSNLTLELHKGAVISGNVVGDTGAAANTLILGGDDDTSFDVSAVGPQYQNFTAYQKTGNSVWTLTGTGSVATPWAIGQGTLQIGDGASVIGDIVNNATLAFNNSNTLTFANVITGTGGVAQVGSGKTILTGANGYTGGTFLNSGTLSVASEANLGDATGALNFNGGVLQVTGTSFTGTARAINWGGGGFDIAEAANIFTVGQVLPGSGSLTKLGAGTLVLTANETYTGGTTISAGALQLGAGGTSGDIAGDVTNNGVLVVNRSDAITLAGVISGTGSVNQTGTGTTTLSGANTYTGGTTISAGALQVGNGGTSGSIAGNITNNGVLVVNRSDAITLAGVISGTGSMNQAGAGTTTFSGANTYAGGTTISAGTLLGWATSFGSGAILDNAALVIDQPADAAFANAINGAGTFTKQGAGRLNFIGTGSLSGATRVAAGILSVNGSLAQSAVTVQSGGALAGNGNVGAATILSGGTIAPGNSIGTLHINGAFAQNAGSVYQVEVDPTSNASDLVLVNGTATIASGATINVTKNPPGNYRLDAQYTVLTASAGITGNYTAGGDTAISQYLALSPVKDANNIYLRVVQTGDPASAATTPNQTATATATDSLPATGGVGSAVLNTPDTNTTRAAFDALSGDALASAKSVLISSSVVVRDTTFDRLRDVLCTDGGQDSQTRRAGCVASDDKPSLWVQGFGDWGRTFGTANAAGVSQTTGGFLTGVDIPVSDWRLGIFGGYSRTNFDAAARASAGTSDTYHLGAYGGTVLGDVRLRVGASYSWSGIDAERLVAINTFTNDLRASYNAGTAQVFGEIGQAFQLNRISLEPFANLAYVGIHTKGFSETGGDAALTSRPDTTQDIFATFGVRPSTEIAIGSISAVLRGMAGWRHTFGDIAPSSLVSFAGGTAFTVTGAPIAKEAGVVEAGISANLSDSAAIGLTYGGQFSNRETDHGIRGTIVMTF